MSGFELTDNAHVKLSVRNCGAELGDLSVHMDSLSSLASQKSHFGAEIQQGTTIIFLGAPEGFGAPHRAPI